MIKELRKIKGCYIGIICLLLISLLFIADIKTGEFIDFSILYFLPIATAAWFTGKKMSLACGLISSMAWIYSELSIGVRYQQTHLLLLNGLLVLIAYLLLAALISRFKQEILKSIERESLIKQEELIIKTTQGICEVIAENVTFHNSKIINWVNKRKRSGHQVSEIIENSSIAIGKNIKKLNEITFSSEQLNLRNSNLKEYLTDLQKKIR